MKEELLVKRIPVELLVYCSSVGVLEHIVALRHCVVCIVGEGTLEYCIAVVDRPRLAEMEWLIVHCF